MKTINKNLPNLPRPSWRVPLFTTSDILRIEGALVVAAAWRALDYASSSRDTVGLIESALPLSVWATLCMTVSTGLMFGMTVRCHLTVWVAHCVGWVTYTALTVGLVLDTLEGWPPVQNAAHGLDPSLWVAGCVALAVLPVAGVVAYSAVPGRTHGWVAFAACVMALLGLVLVRAPLDGLRGVMPVALVAGLHLLFVVRMSPWPGGRAPTKVKG